MDVKIEPSWKKVLESQFDKEYFVRLVEFVRSEYQTGTVYPPAKFIFRAFELTPFDKVKVVILGQDPYHGAGQAHGLFGRVGERDGQRVADLLEPLGLALELLLPLAEVHLHGRFQIAG